MYRDGAGERRERGESKGGRERECTPSGIYIHTYIHTYIHIYHFDTIFQRDSDARGVNEDVGDEEERGKERRSGREVTGEARERLGDIRPESHAAASSLTGVGGEEGFEAEHQRSEGEEPVREEGGEGGVEREGKGRASSEGSATHQQPGSLVLYCSYYNTLYSISIISYVMSLYIASGRPRQLWFIIFCINDVLREALWH